MAHWKSIPFESYTGNHCQAYFLKGERGCVIFLHGWGDHAGRYQEIGEHINKAGFSVLIPDFYGHGRSDGPRARVDQFENLLTDLGTLLRLDAVSQPTILAGHSMGGCLAFHAGIQYREFLDGVIFNSAALMINPKIPAIKRYLAKLLGDSIPHLALTHLKQPWMMSTVKKEIKAYQKDALLHHNKIEAGTGLELMRANHWVERNMCNFKLPFLALQGLDDVLVSPQGPRLLMERSPQTDKTLQEYPAARHDLLHDKVKQDAGDRMVYWLNQRF